MFKIKSKMLEESSRSLASPVLGIQITVFIVVFLVIILLEAVIPSVISLPMMMEEMESQGLLSGAREVSVAESYQIAMGVSAEPGVMIPSLICTVFGTVTSLIYCRWIEIRTVGSMGLRKRKLGIHYIAGLGVGALMMSAITLLSVLFGVNGISVPEGTNYGLIGLYLLGWFFQGMSEEFIFRGYLMTTIGGKHSPWLAVGISAAAFAFAHAMNPGFGVLSCINLVLFGVFAGVYMLYFDDIWGVCGIHTIWNFMQGNFYGISVSGTGGVESVFVTASKTSLAFLSGGEFGIEGSIFTTLVLLTGISLVILKMKKDSEKNAVEE